MKALKIGALLSLFSVAAFASDMKVIEGTIQFEKGQYLIKSENSAQPLTGMNMQALRKFEGKQVKVAGEEKAASLEIYKIFVKENGGYRASYDWDVVNQDLYMD